jgi:antitoxin VapB
MSLRELPDFLKTGDPALTWPRGLEVTPLYPKGQPREPWPQDPQACARSRRASGWRMWRRGGLGEANAAAPALAAPAYIPYIPGMTSPVHTRTFKSGNSVAVRLPKGFAIPPDADVELSKTGDTVTIKLTRDTAEAQRRMRATFEAMKAIGAPPGGVQKRDPFEFLDRAGLFDPPKQR